MSVVTRHRVTTLKEILGIFGALGDIRYDSMSLGEARNLQVMIKIMDGQLSRRIDQLERKRTHPEDHLIKAKEAADKLGRSVDWLYRHADELSFTRRDGRRSLRFSSAGIEDYIRRSHGSR